MPGEKLSYEKQEPAFLRRLRGNAPPDDGRHQIQRNRPKKARDADDDDAPTYVDEESNTLSKEEYEAMVKASETDEVPVPVPGEAAPAEIATKSKGGTAPQKLTEGHTLPRKRKAVKIGGTDDSEPAPEQSSETKKQKKPKKKKAIALSFDEET